MQTMTHSEFLKYIEELQHFYGAKLDDNELEIWYNNLKFMTIERFNYVIAEIYKVNKFMPRLSEILEMHKSIPYTDNQPEIKGDCKKCGNTGYIIYTKLVDGKPYKYTAVCDCGRQQRYDGTKVQDLRGKSKYYIPTINEIGLEVKDNKPTKQQVIESMNKIKDSGIISENIKDLIRKEFIKMKT